MTGRVFVRLLRKKNTSLAIMPNVLTSLCISLTSLFVYHLQHGPTLCTEMVSRSSGLSLWRVSVSLSGSC